MTPARHLRAAWLLLLAMCLLMPGCAPVAKAPATPPASAVGNREAAVDARDSLAVAHLDAALERVTDLRSPEQLAALLKVVRAGFRVVPAPADVKTAKATVAAIVAGDFKPAAAAAKIADDRAATLAAAVQAERDARLAAESALAAEREAHAQEIADLKSSWSKNLQLWTARIFAGAGALVVAVSISAIFWAGLAAKKHIIGGILAGMVSMAVGFAVGETWFLIAGRIVAGLLLASLVGWLIYLVRTAIIERRLRLAIQDAKDEAVAGGREAEHGWAWLKEHLMYRLPRTKTGDASVNEAEIDRRLIAEGVNVPSA